MPQPQMRVDHRLPSAVLAHFFPLCPVGMGSCLPGALLCSWPATLTAVRGFWKSYPFRVCGQSVGDMIMPLSPWALGHPGQADWTPRVTGKEKNSDWQSENPSDCLPGTGSLRGAWTRRSPASLTAPLLSTGEGPQGLFILHAGSISGGLGADASRSKSHSPLPEARTPSPGSPSQD